VIATLKLFRFPLVFTAIADSAAGYLLACRPTGPRPLTLALLAAASGGLYCFGMAMNDIADREIDGKLAPQRALPSGKISLKMALTASCAALALSCAAILLMPEARVGQRLILWGALVAAILGYDFILKVPPTMGFIRACNFALGASVGTGITGGEMAFLAFPLFLYVTALTFVSTLEEGRFSRRRLAAGAGAMGAAALLGSHWSRYLDEAIPIAAPALVTSAILAGWIAWRAVKARDKKGIMLLVRDGVGGVIVLDGTLLMSAGLLIPGLIVASLVLPAALCVAWFKKLG
jgi:4-hydroxybenzoate polyprenyltransferase